MSQPDMSSFSKDQDRRPFTSTPDPLSSRDKVTQSTQSIPSPPVIRSPLALRAMQANDPEPSTDGAVRRRQATSPSTEKIQGTISSDRISEKRLSTTIELAHIDHHEENSGRFKDNPDAVAKDVNASDDQRASKAEAWADTMHEEQEGHLFPYPSVRENMQAGRTFLKRFFLILLIVPAWVIPNVMTARAQRELDLSHGTSGTGNVTGSHAALEFTGLKYVMLSETGSSESGGGAHGPELSLGVNWVIFLLNMLVMMHMGKAACAALEELVPKFGVHVISCIDAFTSSAVELAVAAFALKKGLVVVVQAAMLGAILNNLLLMMGIAILVGGIYNHRQTLKKETTQTSVNILMLTCIAYVVPIALDYTLTSLYTEMRPVIVDPILRREQRDEVRALVDADILKLSKIMSFVLLILYGAGLFYQFHHRTFMITPEAKHEGSHTVERRYTHYWFAVVAYVAVMGAQIYSANLLVHAVESIGRQLHLNDSFVGFVLLPIVLLADLQEEVVAIRESRANRLDKCIALMVGSCMQIALFVTPILVLLGWILGVHMTLRFSVLEVVILAASVLLINYLISDHETNWLEGSLLLAGFVICAIAFYYDNSHLEVTPEEGSTISGGGGH